MLNQRKASPPALPQPQRPLVAATAVAGAAEAAARSWAQLLDAAECGRAVSQIHSVVRDLGMAARSLAAYQADPVPPGPAAMSFRARADAGSQLLLLAWERLDNVVAAEGIPPSGDPDEPGAALCRAAREAIVAWRQPSGTEADRDATVRALITATGIIATAIAGLADCAPRQLAIGLNAARSDLAAAASCLAAAIQPAADNGSPDSSGGGQ